MIDIERETLVTLDKAPSLIPAINAIPGMEPRKPITCRTVRNWTKAGKDGVVLDSVPIGGVIVTSTEAIKRFFQELSESYRKRSTYRCDVSLHGIQKSRRRRTGNDTESRIKKCESIRKKYRI